jgi:membrane protease subunit HflC
VRGDGDAQATRTYGDAFGQDKQFFAFYRSLQAYRDALTGKDTAFVLSPEGNFFRFFGGVPGAMSTAGGNAAPQSANAPPAPGSPGLGPAAAGSPASPLGPPAGAAAAPPVVAGSAPSDAVRDAPRTP